MMKDARREEQYRLLVKQLDALTQDEREPLPNTANMSALLYHTLEDINWAGFYWLKGDELVLGAFQGKPACIRINIARGVCGAAVRTRECQLVPDVHQFAGHIACDSASLSEVVIPLELGDRVLGVLDIDSPSLARFTEDDVEGLRALCSLLTERCDWSRLG